MNPWLCSALLRLQQDQRFDLAVWMAKDLRPTEFARNSCIAQARESGAVVCVQIDHDMTLPPTFGDILHDAIATDKAVVSLPSGIFPPEGLQVIPGDNGKPDGQFRQTGGAGAGILIVNAEVWRAILGPWFRWLTNDDELGSRRLGEDYYFCELVHEHGLKVWTHQCVSGHLKTVNLTPLALTFQRMQKRIADLEHKPGEPRRIEHLNPPIFLQDGAL